MRNIYIIDRPTLEILGVMPYGKSETQYQIECFLASRNVYITSKEIPKKGDYVLYGASSIIKCEIDIDTTTEHFKMYGMGAREKIILTTDNKLIKDGIQAIPYDFLNWLSENQSCEFVEIEFETLWLNKRFGGTWQPFPDEFATKKKKEYKIITPKEPTIDDGWLSPMQRFRLREDKPSTTQEPKITLELTQQEARGLLNCLMRTSANGKDLDVGEMVEEKLWEFLKPLESK